MKPKDTHTPPNINPDTAQPSLRPLKHISDAQVIHIIITSTECEQVGVKDKSLITESQWGKAAATNRDGPHLAHYPLVD